ncbi:MAG: hypothetical protein V4459_09010 [Pseudomonadota bacterium]
MLTIGWGKPVRLVFGAMAAAIAVAAVQAGAAEMRVAKTAAGTAILIAGDFAYGDGERFQQLSATAPRGATVIFDSPGGTLLAGLAIGETIHAKGFNTLVSDGGLCASACAIAWLGGTKRLLAPSARLGFHAASSSDGVSAGGNALVGAYMARLGLSPKAVFALTSADPGDMAWLDLPGAKTLGISVDYYAGPLGRAAPGYASGRAGPIPVATRSGSRYSRDEPAPQPYRSASGGRSAHDRGGDGDGDRECTIDASHSGGC